MPVVKYSKVAARELSEIAAYTRDTWGDSQAHKYISDLETTCTLLCEFPSMGRALNARYPDRRRFGYGSHVIIYAPIRGGVCIQRIVHQKQLLPGNPR